MITAEIEIEDQLTRAIQNCDELLRISRAQARAIADCATNELLALIEERENLIASLELEAPGSEDAATPSDDTVGKRSLLRDKLIELLGVDESNQKAIQIQMSVARSQLLAVTHGRHALNEYTYVKPTAGAVYLDRCG